MLETDRPSDQGTFAKPTFKSAQKQGILNAPDDQVFVAENAFPLHTYILKPYTHPGNLIYKETNP
jgi:hypothetical protein